MQCILILTLDQKSYGAGGGGVGLWKIQTHLKLASKYYPVLSDIDPPINLLIKRDGTGRSYGPPLISWQSAWWVVIT